MEKYIALLRGVNVGGKNKISMTRLKELFEHNGFEDVVTYINSGNIVFSSGLASREKLRKKCEESIANAFGLHIPVTIVSVSDLSAALDHAPGWWGRDKDAKHNAIFVIEPTTVDEVFKEVGAAKPEYEKVDFYGQVIFWSAPVKTFSRTRWSKIVGSSVYSHITIRNANTAYKLLALAKQ